MPDEETPDAQDTSTEQASGPTEGTPAESTTDSQFDPNDYVPKDRYDSLRSEFDRRNPGYSLIEALQDETTQEQTFRDIADQLGYTVEELEDELEETEQQELRDPRVDQILEERDGERREAYLDGLESHVESRIDELAEEAGLELDDEETDLIFAALTPGDDGPDVDGAFKRVTGIRTKGANSVFASKRKAPQVQSGSSASHQPDLDDAEQRRDYIASRIG